MDSEREHFRLESTVRGHHIHKYTWTLLIGEVLQTATERLNEHDRFAVAIMKDENTVGHIPREISKVAWYFLQHGGEITCEISGRRGPVFLEVPCTYTKSENGQATCETLKSLSSHCTVLYCMYILLLHCVDISWNCIYYNTRSQGNSFPGIVWSLIVRKWDFKLFILLALY